MNRIFKSFILLPLLVLTSCNESTSGGASLVIKKLSYNSFKTQVKDKGYKKLIKDGSYKYNESAISSVNNYNLSLIANLSFYDAFRGESSFFYLTKIDSTKGVDSYEEMIYFNDYFNYYFTSKEDERMVVIGKYDKEVDFRFNFNLKPLYQLILDESFVGLSIENYFYDAIYGNYEIHFVEEHLMGKYKVEEKTSLYFKVNDNLEVEYFKEMTQSQSFFDADEKRIKTETKSILFREEGISREIDTSSESYVDLSRTCLPEVRF